MICVVLLGGVSAARAQETARQRAFVYGINAALGSGYNGSFIPPSVRTLYLLADRANVISPRMTEIYFWAITNEYKASWETLNAPVAGQLEIMQGGRVIQQTEPTSYTIQYTPRGTATDAQLFSGADAEAAQARFTAMQQAYQTAQKSYYDAQLAWTAAVDDANKRSANGEKVSVPPAPEPPEPISVVSNGINQGVVVKLAAGDYQIRLRGPDGAIVPDSERSLVVFAPRRSAVGYQVVPETRWTTPEQVDDLSDVILGQPNSQLFLAPHVEREYPARAYALLQNPQQQVGEGAEWAWVAGEPITNGQLQIAGAGRAPETRALTPFRVKQVPGNALGYQIQPFTPDPGQPNAAPDLVGFPIRLDQPGSGFEIRLVSPQGTLVPGSQRLVRAPSTPPLIGLLLVSAVPLVVGAAVIVRRRAKMRLPRNVAG